MKILSRYVLREHLGPLAFALTALTSLLLLNFIAKRFGDLVGKGLPTSVIAEFFMLAIPFTVAMTLPMACLVAVLYAFSRLASESEITALKASGVSMGSVMAPVLGGATVLAIGMVIFNDFILPEANHRLRILQTDIGPYQADASRCASRSSTTSCPGGCSSVPRASTRRAIVCTKS
ncbi:MAG: LptF/LptG family permease [Gemmatimonadaceae bacterium]|nr:LptF/LptG family permease [Gemmatimonadaceae bacterium]